MVGRIVICVPRNANRWKPTRHSTRSRRTAGIESRLGDLLCRQEEMEKTAVSVDWREIHRLSEVETWKLCDE